MNLARSERNIVPLYFQLEQIIKSKIVTGEFMRGGQISTEKKLCQTYGVSSITARQAILNLVRDGFLIRKQGKGTFVRDEIPNLSSVQLKGDINNLIVDGLKIKEVRVLDIKKVKAPKKVADLFQIEEEENVVLARRIRSFNNNPVAYIKNYLPVEIGRQINKIDLTKYPVLQILKDKLKIKLDSGIQYIYAIISDYDISSNLLTDIFSPILYTETIIFSKEKKPIEFAQMFFRPGMFKYSIKLNFKKGKQE